MVAHITLQVGAWTARVDAEDEASVIAILEACERAHGLDSTLEPEARLQNMLEAVIVRHVEDVARGQLAREAVEQARATAQESDAGRFAARAVVDGARAVGEAKG